MPPDSDSIASIQGGLEQLATSIAHLPEIPSAPETMLHILGESRTEAYWEALFGYMLDPAASHGFETDVLESFLQTVAGFGCARFTAPAYQLSDVQVSDQVGADDGRPDILLWVEEEWFCCIELKAHSAESNDQTLRYAASSRLGPLTVEEFPETDRHYLYLAPASKPAPTSDEFLKIDWEDIVPALRTVLTVDRGRYPSKSKAQLADFVDTIEGELSMTEEKQYQREKAALAIEYGNEIEAVNDALKEFVNHELTTWDEEFLAAVSDNWRTDIGGNIYPRMYKDTWFFDESGRVETEDEANLVMLYNSQIKIERLQRQNLIFGSSHRVGIAG